MKVYVIRYEDKCNDDYNSGVMYVFDTLEKAQLVLEEIKKDEICASDMEDFKDLIHDLITENGFIIDYVDDYTKYIIEEMELS